MKCAYGHHYPIIKIIPLFPLLFKVSSLPRAHRGIRSLPWVPVSCCCKAFLKNGMPPVQAAPSSSEPFSHVSGGCICPAWFAGPSKSSPHPQWAGSLLLPPIFHLPAFAHMSWVCAESSSMPFQCCSHQYKPRTSPELLLPHSEQWSLYHFPSCNRTSLFSFPFSPVSSFLSTTWN